jgi:hypothetical protein
VDTEQTWTESYLSQFNAGGNVRIGSDKDVNLLGGTQISAGKDIILSAGRDLNIAANADTYKFRDTSTGATVGYNGSWYVGADHSKSKSDSTTYTNANLQAGGNIVTSSGRNTNIAGANFLAGKVLDVNVGRDLYVATLQNSTQSSSYGGSFTAGYGQGSVSASASEGDRKFSDNQTTLIGQQGVRVNVAGHTQIDGALIANIDANGVDQGNLQLTTQTLGFTDLADNDDFRSHAASIAYSNSESKPAPGQQTGGSPVTYAGATQDVDGVTRATIGKGQVTVGGDTTPDLAGLNRDVSKAQEIFKAESSKGEITVKIPNEVVESIKTGVKESIDAAIGNLSEEERTELIATAAAKSIAGYDYSPKDEQSANALLNKANDLYGTDISTLSFEQKKEILYSMATGVNAKNNWQLTADQKILRDAIYASIGDDPNYVKFREGFIKGLVTELSNNSAVKESAKRWNTMDDSSKQTLIENVVDLQQKLGGNPNYVPVQLVNSPNQPGLSGLFSPQKNVLLVNKASSEYNSFVQTMDTATHEGQHAWQYHLATSPSPSGQIPLFISNWMPGMYVSGSDSPYYLYRSQPLEADSWYVGQSVGNSIKQLERRP